MHYVQNVQKLQTPVSGCHVQYVQKHYMFLDILDMGGETTVLDLSSARAEGARPELPLL
ncbi:MAG: hypothetical protein AB9869_26725 [Verrucomicrobiia bacterium]